MSSPQGRFAAAAAVLDGRVLQCAEAHGKHLFHVYRPDLVVHVHQLRRDSDPDRAWARLSRSRAPLVTLLIDQSVLAGVKV